MSPRKLKPSVLGVALAGVWEECGLPPVIVSDMDAIREVRALLLSQMELLRVLKDRGLVEKYRGMPGEWSLAGIVEAELGAGDRPAREAEQAGGEPSRIYIQARYLPHTRSSMLASAGDACRRLAQVEP